MLQSLLRKNLRKLKSSFIILLFLPTSVLAQDASIIRTNSNVWVNQCKTCHPVYQELAKKTGIRTEQYLFNFVYEHTNKEGEKFGSIISKQEINFVARFILVAAYLDKLERDMRQAGDHLNLKL